MHRATHSIATLLAATLLAACVADEAESTPEDARPSGAATQDQGAGPGADPDAYSEVHDAEPPSGPCARDRDCRDDEFCVDTLDPSGPAVHLACAPRVGAAAPGSACLDHDECRSGRCWRLTEAPGHCVGACADGSDCAEPSECMPVDPQYEGYEGELSTLRCSPPE